MSLNDILNLIEDRMYHLDGTENPHKRFEMLISVIELFKTALKMGRPALPFEIQVGTVTKEVKTKEDLTIFLNKLESWLLDARERVDDDALSTILIRAKIALLQLTYIGIFDRGELTKVDYAHRINRIKEKRHSPLNDSSHDRGD